MPRPAKMYPANSPAYVPCLCTAPTAPRAHFPALPAPPHATAAALPPTPFSPLHTALLHVLRPALPLSASHGFPLAPRRHPDAVFPLLAPHSPRRVSGFPFVPRPAHHAFFVSRIPTLHPHPAPCTPHPALRTCPLRALRKTLLISHSPNAEPARRLYMEK